MSLAAHPPKRRQYAAGESHVYYGSAEGQQSLGDIQHPSEESNPLSTTIPESRHIDLMTYPPDPRDLRIPPPEIRLPSDSCHSSSGTSVGSAYQASTLNAVPSTESLLHDVKLPLGLVVSPYRTLTADEEPVPTVQDGVITRCQACRAYINPYVQFFDGGNRWRCSLCGAPNDVPQAFDWSVVVNQPCDRYARAELTHPVVDFAATAEYVRDAPQAPAYVFLIDVSLDAMRSGMFVTAIHTLSENLDNLPNEARRTRVALVCYDVSLYFFSLPPGAEAFDMLVVSDLDDAYVPRPYDLLVNLADARLQLDVLLQRLPAMFAGAPASGSATGPALDGALALICPTGGKIVLLSASVPTRGKGALDVQEHVPGRDKQQEPELDKSASAFYHAFALACIKACVSVDMFLAGDQYRGVATLTLLPQYTAGQTFYYPAFSAADPEDTVKFAVELGRVLAMHIMLEAEMRVRCSRGISVKSIHGNFFLQGTDRVVMPAVPLDQSYAFEFQIDSEPLAGPLAVFQTALLHTTSAGERRIRVLTLALPTTSAISDVFVSADVRALVTLIAKQTVQRPSVLALEDKLAALQRRVADLCAAYTTATKSPASDLALLLPAPLKMLPILLLGLFKKISTRLDTERALDVRAYARVLLNSTLASQLIRYTYPDVYCLHNMPEDVGFIGAEGTLRMPAALPLTSAWWEPHGLYLIDDGQAVYLWVGRDAVPALVSDVFGVQDYAALRSGKIALPDVDTAISQRIRAIIGKIRERTGTPHYPSVYVVKDDSTSGDPGLRSAVVQMLIHDRGDELRVSYRQFLVKIHGK